MSKQLLYNLNGNKNGNFRRYLDNFNGNPELPGTFQRERISGLCYTLVFSTQKYQPQIMEMNQHHPTFSSLPTISHGKNPIFLIPQLSTLMAEP